MISFEIQGSVRSCPMPRRRRCTAANGCSTRFVQTSQMRVESENTPLALAFSKPPQMYLSELEQSARYDGTSVGLSLVAGVSLFC